MVSSICGYDKYVYATHGNELLKIQISPLEIVQKIETRLVKIGVCPDFKYLVGISEKDKAVALLDIESLDQKRKFVFPKKPSSWSINKSDLVVADKFGDVFHVDLSENNDNNNNNIEEVEVIKSKPIVGHVSMILDVQLNNNFVFTSDRDEHIRVSNFPDSFVVDKYLLGSQFYVAHILLKGDLLVSAGGGAIVKCWNWKTGDLLNEFDLTKVPGIEDEIEVVSIDIGDNSLYVAVEGSNKVVKLDLPSMALREVYTVDNPVNDLCCWGGGCWIASGTAVGSLLTNDRAITIGNSQQPDNCTQKHLRKTLLHRDN